MIKLADTLAPMADFPAVEAKDVAFNDNKSLQEKYDNGELGGGSGSGEENKIDSISVNGTPISPDENKNVDITVPSIEGLTKDADLAIVAKSGDYDDLANKPIIPSLDDYAKTSEIPTKVSQLENDSNYLSSIPEEYVTETELNAKGYLTEHQDISGLQTKTDDKLATTSKEVVGAINELKKGVSSISVPTKVSQLTNDSGYLSSVPSEYVTETKLNAKGYLTEHQDISNLALKSEIPDVSSFITSDDLPTVPTKVSELTNDKNYISSIPSEYVTETELTAKKYLTSVPSTYALKTDIPTVPTKTSQLTNDSNFITSIPEEYITETELKAKGYLTSHQDISGLQTKTDDSLTTTDKTVIGAINELKTNISNINTGGGSSFSGSYNDLTDKPTIPTKTSDLTNDSGYLSTEDITTTIDSSSTDTQIPTAKAVNDILSTVTGITNVRKVFYGLDELNNAKGTNISLVVGEDNTMKIVDALSPIETFADYFHNDINSNRFGIDANTYGTEISLLIITKFNDNTTIIRAYMSNGKLLTRRHLNGVLQDWSYDKGNSKDVPNTVIVSEDLIVNLNSNCYYTVINGVCYVTLWGFTCTGAGQYVVNSSMPKTKLTMKGICTYGSSGYEGGCAYVLHDGKDNNKLYIEVKSTNEPLYGSFSYPVA